MCPISRSLLCSLVYRASAAVWRHHSPATNIRGRRFHHFCCLASRRSALGRRLIVQPSVPSGLDIYSAAKKFETDFFCDFANVEGFQQHSFVGHIEFGDANHGCPLQACRVESRALLTATTYIVQALAAEVARTMDGAAVDLCIERAGESLGGRASASRRYGNRREKRG
jgi:hypothetical protein